MPPTILCITRSPVDIAQYKQITIDLTPIFELDPIQIAAIVAKFLALSEQDLKKQILDDSNSTEIILSNLKTWITTQSPVLLGVEPGQKVYLYLYDIDHLTNLGVVSDGLAEPLVLGGTRTIDFLCHLQLFGNNILHPLTFPVVEMEVAIPDMTVWEDKMFYTRNAVMAGNTLKLVDQNKNELAHWLPFPVWLPFPQVGLVEWRPGQTEMTLGYIKPPDGPDPGPQPGYEANHLGREAYPDTIQDENAQFGQLRFYNLDSLPKFDFVHPHDTSSATIIPDPKKPMSLRVPGLVSDRLAEVRCAGQWLCSKWDRSVQWTDDGVKFKIPEVPQKPGLLQEGVAVIWRDDLPSRPVVCFDLVEYAKRLVARLWQPVLGDGTFNLDIPIPIGEVVKLGVAQLEDSVNNAMAKIFQDKKLKVRFAFLTEAYIGNQGGKSAYLDDNLLERSHNCIGKDGVAEFIEGFNAGQIGLSDLMLSFKVRPQITDKELTEAEKGAFSVQLTILIDGGDINLLGYDFHFPNMKLPVGPKITFHPEPLRVPTVAIFFPHPDFTGAPLVTLPAGSLGNSAISVDANTPGELNKWRYILLDVLKNVSNVLGLIDFFYDKPPLGLIKAYIDELTAIGSAAIDSSGNIDHVGKLVFEKHWYGDSNYNDCISSAILIGAPHRMTHAVVKCYQHNVSAPNPGRCLELRMPDRHFFAAIPSFTDLKKQTLHNPKARNPVFDTTYTLPTGDNNPAWPSATWNSFDDILTGIKFDVE
jgi:hypothetical protein